MAFLSSDICDLLTTEVVDTLRKHDIWTVNDFFALEPMEIRHKTNLKYGSLKEIMEKIKYKYTAPLMDASLALQQSVQRCKMCPTGLPELTSALDGGFQTQEIVEFFGDSGCGKTEMCLLLCGEMLSHYNDYNILYVASNYDFDIDKVSRYIKVKSGGRISSEDDIFGCLSRVEIAKPTRLHDLVLLLNSLVHKDRKKLVKCIVIDSISMIIQEDLLKIKNANLADADEIQQIEALRTINPTSSTSRAGERECKESAIDIYVHEIMRLLTTIAVSHNVMVIITNSDPDLASYKSYTNATDHRLELARMPEYSRYKIQNPKSTVCRATILKTIHNVSRVGYTIPFEINNEGIYALRLQAKREKTDIGDDDGDDSK